MTLVIYTKPACPNCDILKGKLTRKGIDYTVVDVSQDAGALALLKNHGHRSVPQLYRDGFAVPPTDPLWH